MRKIETFVWLMGVGLVVYAVLNADQSPLIAISSAAIVAGIWLSLWRSR